MPPDPRDAALIEAIVASIYGLMLAVEQRSGEEIAGHLSLLVNAVVEHNATLAERPDDAALQRALARV